MYNISLHSVYKSSELTSQDIIDCYLYRNYSFLFYDESLKVYYLCHSVKYKLDDSYPNSIFIEEYKYILLDEDKNFIRDRFAPSEVEKFLESKLSFCIYFISMVNFSKDDFL